MEIYLNVSPDTLPELIGLGPACDPRYSLALGFKREEHEKFALIAQLTSGEVLACRFEAINLDDDSAFVFERNYILPEEFAQTGLDEKVRELIDGKTLRLFLGDSWDNERFLTWEKKDSDFLQGISLKTAVRVERRTVIARHLELFEEMNHFQSICDETELKSKVNLRSRSITKKDFDSLYNSEVKRSAGRCNTKPNLDEYDKYDIYNKS